MSPRLRQSLLYGALLATALAVVFAPEAQDAVQPAAIEKNSPVERMPSLAATLPDAPAASAAMLPQQRVALAAAPRDLFHIEPPPAVSYAQTAAAPPPPPMAPPLPYVYMGKSYEQGEVTVFLTRNNKPYLARPGDVLDGQYRVDAINPPLLELTYLPLAQKQMLNIGAAR